MPTPAFLVVPVPLMDRVFLRRFSRSDEHKCPATGYHCEAKELLGDFPRGEYGDTVASEADEEGRIPRSDPRWPAVCEKCKEPFDPKDYFQVFVAGLYYREGGPKHFPKFLTLHTDKLPGMMWYCPWYHDPKDTEKTAMMRAKTTRGVKPSKDYSYMSAYYWHDWAGKRAPLNVLCPNLQEWTVDANSSNGAGWIVTGEAPLITCSPSIAVPGYHGHLQNGIFTDDIEGRGPMGTRTK